MFTSGATESNNLAILGYARANADRGRHLVSVRTEHKSVLDAARRLQREGFTITWLTPGATGLVEPAALAAALRPDTLLASIMYANNETGVLQDITALAASVASAASPSTATRRRRRARCPSTCRRLAPTCSPSRRTSSTDRRASVRSTCAAARAATLQPLTFGGGQERGLRPGTLPTHQLAGFGAACEIARRELAAESARLADARRSGCGRGLPLWVART